MARKKTYASLKRTLDRVVSVYTRMKWADREGIASCFICGHTEHWGRLQAAHFISRVHLSTRFLDENLYPCCYSCNVLRRGNYPEFALKLGQERVAHLVSLKHQPVKFNRAQLETQIGIYQAKIKKLESRQTDE